MKLGKWSNNAPSGSRALLKDWIDDLWKSGDSGKAVQLNFIEETRLSKSLMKKFLKALVKEYKKMKSKDQSDPELARLAVVKAVNSDKKFRGILRLPKIAPDNIVHFISLRTIKRFKYASKQINYRKPQKYVYFNRGLGMAKDGKKAVPHIWITFSDADKSFDEMDATAIRDALGMSNVRAHDYLYKVDIALTPIREELYVPSVLDAEGKPPWFPVPRKSPWGITRNLNNDAEEFPELLRQPLSSAELAPRGQLVCDQDGKPSCTGAPSEDYLNYRIKKHSSKL